MLNGLGLVSYHQGKFAVMVKVMLGLGLYLDPTNLKTDDDPCMSPALEYDY